MRNKLIFQDTKENLSYDSYRQRVERLLKGLNFSIVITSQNFDGLVMPHLSVKYAGKYPTIRKTIVRPMIDADRYVFLLDSGARFELAEYREREDDKVRFQYFSKLFRGCSWRLNGSNENCSYTGFSSRAKGLLKHTRIKFDISPERISLAQRIKQAY